MEHLLMACACGLDAATEGMAIQIGVAAAVSAPFWFRAQVVNVVRRLRGKRGAGRIGSMQRPRQG